MGASVRHPAVAGRFYPRDRVALLKEVRSYLSPEITKVPAIGCVVPHAGYIYSGKVAGAVYSRMEVPSSCIVLCPNHTGMGQPIAILSTSLWETPLGLVPTETDLARALKARFPLLTEDTGAHLSEHAIEVQLPFLQVRHEDFALVPIALGTQDLDALEGLGTAVADVITERQRTTLIVASSDMNHYESDRVTRIKDQKAIDRLLALDAKGLYEVVVKEDISMCGFGPAVVMLTAAKLLGARSAELVRYATSGDVSGDREMVVGYAGIVVT